MLMDLSKPLIAAPDPTFSISLENFDKYYL